MPVPESEIDRGLLASLSVTTRVAERVPFAPGLKVTLIEHVAFGERDPEQLLDAVKSPAFLPDTATFVIESPVPPALVTVMGFVELPVVVFTVPKARLPGLNVATGSMTVAVSGTVCGLPRTLSLMVRVAVCGV